MVTNTQAQPFDRVRLMFPVLMSGRAKARGGLATVGWAALPPHPDAAEVRRPEGGGEGSTVRVRNGVLNDPQVGPLTPIFLRYLVSSPTQRSYGSQKLFRLVCVGRRRHLVGRTRSDQDRVFM
jgi:hypothetical protein